MLPQDPVILFSYLNTKLRDEYSSLDRLCDDMDISRKDLEDILSQAGFTYDAVRNRFI
ncbi:MAG: DUF4250 domain-containing protein [Eubacteriales bacterium]|nr:DUF4250 domain-containing protein [Eubacteriales bacterium]